MLDIAPNEIPPGSDYQWITLSVCGDTSLGQLETMKAGGWREVPLERHASLVKRSQDPRWIVYGGLILVERPQLVTERAHVWEAEKAKQQRLAGHRVEVERKVTAREWASRERWTTWVWLRETRQYQAMRRVIVRAAPTCTLWRWAASNTDHLEFVLRPKWRISRYELLNTI